jgi:hypothetical protein
MGPHMRRRAPGVTTYDPAATHSSRVVPDEASAAAPSADTPEAVYRSRVARFTEQRDHIRAKRAAVLGRAQLVGGLGALCLFFAIFGQMPYLAIPGVLVLILSAGMVVREGRTLRLAQRYDSLRQVNADGLARLRRAWDALPLPSQGEGRPGAEENAAEADEAGALAPFAGDLDLLGRASLLHLLGTANTPGGQATLRRWLLQPASPAVVRERQGAVAELAPWIDEREEVALYGKQISLLQPTYEPFLRWAEGASWLIQRTALIWLTRLLPVALVALLVAEIAGLITFPYWLGVAALNWLLASSLARQVEARLDQVASRQSAFGPYAELFATLSRQTFASPLLQRLQEGLHAENVHADQQMAWLARIMRYGDLRLSAFGPFLQFGLLWNFHVLWFLERWQRDSGHHVRAWLATLSELEALSALATLTHDQPDWALPEVMDAPGAPDEPVFVAADLGHPLLPPDTCVRNDLAIGPVGTFLMLTGSNMSGKSTLLRTAGLNVVLAQAGGPVCATSLRMAPIALASSIRVRDSLELGMSYYMAELARLKQVVDVADAIYAYGRDSMVPLFLLDEILHGTNSSERRIAASAVIDYLLAHGATGIVTTHDLSLAQLPELAAVSQRAHFTESFTRDPEGLTMRFDYRLHPGLATSTNALKLMEMAGLPLPHHDG